MPNLRERDVYLLTHYFLKKEHMHMLTFTLLLIGGLNWLLLGLFQWDLGQLFGGQTAVISRVIYVLVGLSALYEVATHKGSCKTCGMMKKGGATPAAPSA